MRSSPDERAKRNENGLRRKSRTATDLDSSSLAPMSRAVVLSAVRTPVGRYGGALSRIRPDDLAATAIKAAVERSGVEPSELEDVILGGENVAEQCGVSREEQDAFALRSHQRAIQAIETGRFQNQIVPVMVPQPKGEPVEITRDEHPRADTSMEALAKLRPAFREGGSVTAGNSSGINDGASATVLVEAGYARDHDLKPLARVVSTAVAGVDPSVMGLGPIPATRKALDRADL